MRLANFHTTALCSPTRACLLTGRNHHSVGMGRIADLAVGFPGYSGRIERRHGFVSEILAAHGYATYAVGKWHLTPEDETHMAAPRGSWPVGRGFQRWYGFHGGETHQFVPTLFQDNQWVAPPASPESGYHLSEDLADRAIGYLADLRAVDGDQPFFLYFATGACHSPHHAPEEWIARYAGHFDDGWDAWRARTFAAPARARVAPGVDGAVAAAAVGPRVGRPPAGGAARRGALHGVLRRLPLARRRADRPGAGLRRRGARRADDTLVVLVSDNGASAEGGALGSINDVRIWNGTPAGRRELQARIDELGGPSAHNNYPWGWTMAGNTPFRRWKREVHEGGVADPCIVRWLDGIDARGEVRHQFAHAIDVLPTILDLVGVDAPPRDRRGRSSRRSRARASPAHSATPRAPAAHVTQYFEMLGSRAIHDGEWKAVTFKPLGRMYDDGLDPDAPFDEDRWELYHVADDFSECHDLRRGRARAPRGDGRSAWWEEARRYHVLPLDNRPLAALLNPRPSHRAEQARHVYFPGGAPVPEPVAPNVRNRSHTIVADIDVAPGVVPEGVLLALGSVLGGWTLYVLGGTLRYEHNFVGKERHRVVSDVVIPPGEHRIGFGFVRTADFAGTGRLFLDGEVVGEGEIPRFTPARFSITGAGLTCGYEVGPAVSGDYTAPFPFNATLRRVAVEVSGAAHHDVEAEFRAIMSEQ